MKTLLLRLAAPMQSWGDESDFEYRRTKREPTKSGVIGMISSAMGIKRSEDSSFLYSLRFGVRVDQEGIDVDRYDYQITRTSKKNNRTGSYSLVKNGEYELEEKSTILSYRYYLYDAVFLVGLEGDDDLIVRVQDALKRPMWPLFLGRRSCPPSGRMLLGIRNDNLEDALTVEPFLAGENISDRKLRFVVEPQNSTDDSYYLKDQPITYNQSKRSYGRRKARTFYKRIGELSTPKEHDPFSVLL